jgi:hypothetical protein
LEWAFYPPRGFSGKDISMTFEELQRKQAAVNELMQIIDRIKVVLSELSIEESQAILDGMHSVIQEIQQSKMLAKTSHSKPSMQSATRPIKAQPQLPLASVNDASSDKSTHASSDSLLTPAQAVMEALRSNPEGLTSGEIVDLCMGKFRTTSEEPRNVIYSAIAGFKNRKRIEPLADGRYRLRQESGDFAGLSAIACCVAILKERNEPMNALTLAKVALDRGYVGRAKGKGDSEALTTAKSFWARMSRSDLFIQTGPETFKLNPDPDAIAKAMASGGGKLFKLRLRHGVGSHHEKDAEGVSRTYKGGDVLVSRANWAQIAPEKFEALSDDDDEIEEESESGSDETPKKPLAVLFIEASARTEGVLVLINAIRSIVEPSGGRVLHKLATELPNYHYMPQVRQVGFPAVLLFDETTKPSKFLSAFRLPRMASELEDKIKDAMR